MTITVRGGFAAIILSVLLYAVPTPGYCGSRNSPDVPLYHWSYDAIERLAVGGLIDMSLLSTKPYTRLEMARMTRQAMDQAKTRKLDALRDTTRVQSLLYRLMDEYRPELLYLGVDMLRDDRESTQPYQCRLSEPVRAHFVGISAGSSLTGVAGQNSRRALFDPDGVLMENNNGWLADDGVNVRSTWRGWMAHNDWGVVSAESANFLSSDTQRFQMQELYVRTSIWKMDLLVGRESLWWGPGYHGALLLSNNARPLDLVRLSTSEPFTPPSVFRHLGPMRVNYVMARLDADRDDFRKPLLNGMRAEFSPAPWLSIGLTRTIMMGGSGRTPSVSQYVKNIFFAVGENTAGSAENAGNTDQKAGLDFRVRVADAGRFLRVCRELEIYGEVAGEDEAKFLGIPVPSNLAWILGIYIPDIFSVSGLDFRFEWASNRVPGKPDVWYRHFIYTDGYTIDGRIIGHHMGSQADDWFVRLSKSFDDGSEMAVHFDVERHGLGFSNVETKYEAHFEFEYPVSEQMSMKSFYRVQRFANARNVIGASRTNHIFGLMVQRTF